MPSVNTIIIIGNLGSDPEMRFTPDGKPTTSFTVATNRSYTTGTGEKKEETEWFKVVTWGKLAENCNQYLTKGQLIFAEGRLHASRWEGQDGKTHFQNEVIARDIKFLTRSNNTDRKTAGQAPLEEDDIPF